jgi:chitodextrinase
VARFDADTLVFVGGAHDEVVFDASRSTDPDRGYLRYEWDLGDGTKTEGVRVRHTYFGPGRYTVTLTVSDPSGTDCSVSVVRFTVNARRREGGTVSSDGRGGTR